MEIIYNRLHKNHKHLSKWARRQGLEAWRLYHWDIPDYPFTVDLYQDYVVLTHYPSELDLEEKKQDHLLHIHQAIMEVLQVPDEHIYYKSRRPSERFNQMSKLDQAQKEMVIKEGPAHFLVNLSDYIDTGLFLDHRPLRKHFATQLKAERLLNLFCYTGSLSVMAALQGTHTVNVDSSNTYLTWAQQNFHLNKLGMLNHTFIANDVMNFLRQSQGQYAQHFDAIYVDAPTFSNSKKLEDDFEIQKDHVMLLRMCGGLLSPKGKIYFSCHKRKFKMAEELSDDFVVKDIQHLTTDEDFKRKPLHQSFTLSWE